MLLSAWGPCINDTSKEGEGYDQFKTFRHCREEGEGVFEILDVPLLSFYFICKLFK